MYHCLICHEHARKTLPEILRHIREVHPHFQDTVSCGINGCPSTASSYEALRRHMYRYHKNLLNCSSALIPTEENYHESQLEVEGTDSIECEDNSAVSEDPISTRITAAKFILKTRDGKGLTQVATDGIIADTKLMIQSSLQYAETKVLEMIDRIGVALTEPQCQELKVIFADENVLNPFLGLDTEYQQEKFIKEHFNYVVSCHYFPAWHHFCKPYPLLSLQ